MEANRIPMRQTRTYFLILGLFLCLFSCEEEIGEGLQAARTKLDSGNPKEALAIADSLLEVDANDMNAVLLGAEALYVMEDHAQSIYYLGEFLQARSTDAHGFLLRAKNYRATGKTEAAYSDLEAAVKYDPYLDEAVEMLLSDYYRDKNWKSWLNRLWDLEKKRYQGGVFFGMCSIRGLVQGNSETANRFAEKAVEEEAGRGMEYFQAKIWVEYGQPQKALDILDQVETNPIFGGSVSFLEGMAYLQLEKYFAVDQCLKALRKEGRETEADYLEARKLMRQGEYESAVALLDTSKLDEIQREAMVQFIEAEMEVGLFGNDHVYIESGNPFYVESLVYNASWNLKSGWVKEARDIIGEAIKLNPEHPLALFVQGCVKLEILERGIEGSGIPDEGLEEEGISDEEKEEDQEDGGKAEIAEDKVEETTGCEDLQHAIDNKLGIIYGEKYEQEAIKLCK